MKGNTQHYTNLRGESIKQLCSQIMVAIASRLTSHPVDRPGGDFLQGGQYGLLHIARHGLSHRGLEEYGAEGEYHAVLDPRGADRSVQGPEQVLRQTRQQVITVAAYGRETLTDQQ